MVLFLVDLIFCGALIFLGLIFVVECNHKNKLPRKFLHLQYIRKYGSSFYVGMGRVQNGYLHLRYESSSEKTTAK